MLVKLRYLWLLGLVTLTLACELDDTLDRSTVSIEDTYFVECYLQPNELYNLTATEIQPIFDDFILDYSLDFDVFIIGDDTTELLQSLFVDDQTGFVFNYGRGVRLDPALEEVSLFVLTPTKDTIIATTNIPDPVSIVSAKYTESSVYTAFELSEDIDQNFYLHIIDYPTYEQDSVYSRNLIQFLDLSDIEAFGEYEVALELEDRVDSLAIEVTVMRVTEENYKYQRSLFQAKEASDGKVTYPAPIQGNLIGGEGIFTCFQSDNYIIN